MNSNAQRCRGSAQRDTTPKSWFYCGPNLISIGSLWLGSIPWIATTTWPITQAHLIPAWYHGNPTHTISGFRLMSTCCINRHRACGRRRPAKRQAAHLLKVWAQPTTSRRTSSFRSAFCYPLLKAKSSLSRFSFFCFGLESFQNELETLSTETLSTQKVAGNIIYGLRFHRILGNIIRNNIQKSQMLPVFG